eukprot:scaffold18583_cov57-Phaeocystis_antarctica.AAC.1
MSGRAVLARTLVSRPLVSRPQQPAVTWNPTAKLRFSAERARSSVAVAVIQLYLRALRLGKPSPMRTSAAALLLSCCSVAGLASSAASVVQPRLAACVHRRAPTPAMLEDAGSVAAFLASNQKVAAFLAIGSLFGISSAVSRMSAPAGEDIVASAVAGDRNRFAELPTPS